MKPTLRYLMYSLMLVLVTACGGGGDGGSTAPNISSFAASNTTITAGDSVNLTAIFAGGFGSIDNDVGSVSSNVAKSVNPTTTTTYTLTVTTTPGVSVVSTVSVTSTVTVTVVPALTITSFVASNYTITAGDSVDLTAVFTDGTANIDNGVGAVTSAVAKSVTPATTTTYTVTVTNAAGTAVTAPVTVTVVSLDSLSITSGDLDQIFQSTQLSYTATVGFLAKSIKVQATTAEPGATIKVNDVVIGPDNFSQDIALAEGANAVSITVTKNSVTETYSLTVTRQTIAAFAQQAYVKASNTDAGDQFGYYAVSLSGNTLAVGTYFEDSNETGINGNQVDNSAVNSGAVYVFTRSGTTWTQQAYIKASNTDADDQFGFPISLSGDTLAVGAAREDSNETGINGNQVDNSAVNSGAVYVFTRSGTNWTQQAYIKASNTDADDQFGYAVSLSGNTLAVGARLEDSAATGINGIETDNTLSMSGAVYVFTRNGTTWAQEAYIKRSNNGTGGLLGLSTSLSGDTLAVGANNSAYVFTRNGTTWTQQAYIEGSNTETLDYFGTTLSLSGDTLAVGAAFEDSATTGINGIETDNTSEKAGAVYVFTRDVTTWSQQAYIKASNTDTEDWFGIAVSLSGDTLAVGARQEDSAATGINGTQGDNSTQDSGAVYIFTRNGTTWTQQSYIKASNTNGFDAFGIAVNLSGDTLAVGAFLEDSSATGIDGSQGNGSENGSGAVYVFE